MGRPLANVIKTYPRRGSMQQFRLDALTAFDCFRCHRTKKSKLVVVYDDDWNRFLCNGCYGFLLSVYKIKAGTGPENEKAARLGDLLLNLATKEQAYRAAELSEYAQRGEEQLSDTALRFIGTSEYVASAMQDRTDLDWSAAVVGICKALELECVRRLVEPLRQSVAGADLSQDLADRDLGRVATYCRGTSDTPPELGTIRHLLETASHSKTRAQSSTILRALKRLLAGWPQSAWLLDEDGALKQLARVTAGYRNRAVHLDAMTSADYRSCRALVLGEVGAMWNLVRATQAPSRK